MEPPNLMELTQDQHNTDEALLDAQLELWHNTFAYVKSMALKAALDLGIPDAIHHHVGGATLAQIAAKVVALHPSKLRCLRRLMRALTATGIITVAASGGSGDPAVYGLTPASRLLVDSPNSVTPLVAFLLRGINVTPFLELGAWFQRELPGPSIFEAAHGESMWGMAGRDAAFSAEINAATSCDSRFLMDVAIRGCRGVFEGVTSLVDVGGGHGGAAIAISEAFPHVKCSVLDLAHVVASAPSGTAVQYIAGDMFESIPPANAMFIKWVLHDWDDNQCVKILRNCRKAIPPKDAGGKVIIIDMVIESDPQSNYKHKETQVFMDLLTTLVNGCERDEHEWRKIFVEAGFSDYKIMPVLGVRSIIELYP